MSLQEYQESKEISYGEKDFSFYGLLMAAMRAADSNNVEILKRAFPGVWAELRARYNAPGGKIGEEVEPVEPQVTPEMREQWKKDGVPEGVVGMIPNSQPKEPSDSTKDWVAGTFGRKR